VDHRAINLMPKRLLIVLAMSGWWSVASATTTDAPVPPLTAAQVVEKNVQARGGLDAWRKVSTMVWLGHLQSIGTGELAPFVLQMKRPDKMRFEVTKAGQKAIRAFDGAQGWKVRPPRTGKAELLPFTADEVQFARDAPGIDGPLIDHEAKGIGVVLDGADEVDGHKAYRLAVKLPSGTTRHVWVDAETFLDIRYDRSTQLPGGRTGSVYVYYRDYKSVEGLKVPMTLETRSVQSPAGDRMVIDRVLLNTNLDDDQFAYPGTEPRSHAGSAGFGAPSQLVPPAQAGQPRSAGGPAGGSPGTPTPAPVTAPADTTAPGSSAGTGH